MRLDRFITLNFVQPARRVVRALGPRPSSLGASLPVLMYHGISAEPEPGVAAYYQTNTSPAVFREQMGYLAQSGYRTLDLPQALKFLRREHGQSATPDHQPSSLNRAVVITFDDGLRDFYTQAFPVLKEHGFTATMFLATGFIRGSQSSSSPHRSEGRAEGAGPRPSKNGAEYLTWNEIREMQKAGIRFGSHTVNHPRLIELSWPEIKRELADSKNELENRLGEPATDFAYPFAFPQSDRAFVEGFRSILAETGYACCATTEIGRAHAGDDPYRLKRLPANSLDDRAFFRAKLEGAYDWLALPQALSKRVRRCVRAGKGRKNLAVAAPTVVSR
jgi:peptidoglycan/xylan/chitin deacetylase (PgdA/CDA1 family)